MNCVLTAGFFARCCANGEQDLEVHRARIPRDCRRQQHDSQRVKARRDLRGMYLSNNVRHAQSNNYSAAQGGGRRQIRRDREEHRRPEGCGSALALESTRVKLATPAHSMTAAAYSSAE